MTKKEKLMQEIKEDMVEALLMAKGELPDQPIENLLNEL